MYVTLWSYESVAKLWSFLRGSIFPPEDYVISSVKKLIKVTWALLSSNWLCMESDHLHGSDFTFSLWYVKSSVTVVGLLSPQLPPFLFMEGVEGKLPWKILFPGFELSS